MPSKLTLKFSLLIIGLIANVSASASTSLGGAASQVTDLMSNLSQFFTAITFAIGFGFGVGAIIKYKAYRDNPQQVGLSVPITLFLVALAFVGIGLTLIVTGQAIFGYSVPSGTNAFS